MSQPSRCFSLTCLSRNKSSSQEKLKPPLKLPTMREFLNSHSNAGTQTRTTDSFFSKPRDFLSISSKNTSTPNGHKSTIAIRRGAAFQPMSFPEKSSNQSVVSNVRQDTQDKTLFMSLQSFDSMFGKNIEEKKEPRADPFVFSGPAKPKIKPVTPMGWKRNPGCKGLAKNSFFTGSLLQELRNENLGSVNDSKL
jgi:hypothetical protein